MMGRWRRRRIKRKKREEGEEEEEWRGRGGGEEKGGEKSKPVQKLPKSKFEIQDLGRISTYPPFCLSS